jgi:hypothetical protein
MVTKVKCVNMACQNYGVRKSVASAGLMEMDYRKCATCGGKTVAAERTSLGANPHRVHQAGGVAAGAAAEVRASVLWFTIPLCPPS